MPRSRRGANVCRVPGDGEAEPVAAAAVGLVPAALVLGAPVSAKVASELVLGALASAKAVVELAVLVTGAKEAATSKPPRRLRP